MPPDQERVVPVVRRFRPLFLPRSVAVVGASGKSVAQGNTFIRHLQESGFQGAIYPIHPTEAALEGLPAYPSLAQTPEPIDYAFVAVAAERVPELLAAADGRVRIAQVMSSGFGERPEGRDLERALVESARRGGMRLLGPNCMGTYSPRGRLTFVEGGVDAAGGVGVLSQSGGLSIDILRIGRGRGLRFSGIVSLGNCADLGVNDLLEYYLADPETRVIGAYLEHVHDGRRFFEQLRAANAGKPVVILKGGRTKQGQRAAASHTGSLAGNEEVWQALAQQTGSTLVDTLEQFIDVLVAFQAYLPRVHAPTGRVLLFGNGGGASVLGTDCLARLGLDVAPLDPATHAVLEQFRLPPGASIANPVDVPANVLQKDGGALALRILETIASHETPEAILMHFNLPVIFGYRHVDMLGDLIRVALRTREALRGRAHLVMALRANGDPESESRKRDYAVEIDAAGVAVFNEITNAAYALAALHGYEKYRFARRQDSIIGET
ncbi:MAG: CoA-binding protein [Burkholderiales bacterium]|nr:CoA-binding protein [Burkholderiales bacterium]